MDTIELKVACCVLFWRFSGAVFTYYVSKHRQQIEFVIRVSNKYLDNFDEIGMVKAFLACPLAADDHAALNRIRKTGDWFELIAIYNESHYLSKSLLAKTGLLADLRKFHELVTQRKNEPRSPLNDAWLWLASSRQTNQQTRELNSMPAQSRSELLEQLKGLDHLDSAAQLQVTALISLYVDFLLKSRGQFLAGPLATPGSPAKTTHSTFVWPSCGYKISAGLK